MGLYVACDESFRRFFRYGDQSSKEDLVHGIYSSVMFADSELAEVSRSKVYPKNHTVFEMLAHPNTKVPRIPWDPRFFGFEFTGLTGDYRGPRGDKIVDAFNKLIDRSLVAYARKFDTTVDKLNDVTILIDGHEFEDVTDFCRSNGWNVEWYRYGDERIKGLNAADYIASFLATLTDSLGGSFELEDGTSVPTERIQELFDNLMTYRLSTNRKKFVTDGLQREFAPKNYTQAPNLEGRLVWTLAA